MPEDDSIARQTLCASLRSNADSLRIRGAQGELLVIEDLFLGVPPLPDSVSIFCLDSYADGDQEDTAAREVSPGLSFLWTTRGIDKFGSAERLKKRLSEFREGDTGTTTIGKSVYEYTPNETIAYEIARSLSCGVDVLLDFSLNAVNKSQDLFDALSRDLLREVSRVEGRFGLQDMAHFVGNATNLDFGLLHLTRTAGSAPVITVSTTSTSPESLSSLCDFLGLSLDSFSTKPDGVANPFLAEPLPQSVEADLIVNAATWGKALSSATPGDLKKRILILPITRPLGPRGDREEPSVLAAPDLLFTFTNELTRNLLDKLRACVDTFSQYRFGARRLNLLSNLQQNLPFDRPGMNLRIGSSKGIAGSVRIKDTLKPLLNEVLYTTSAHSVSVRLYDPKTKSLMVEAIADFAVTAPEMTGRPIPIKNNSRTSVAAFLFLNANPTLPYVYLKKISPPTRWQINDREKVKNRTYIPEEYKALGLQAPLITRELTRSEICFALVKGRLAFGTFNLEAPYPSAFDNDIDYLKLVKLGIEKLYDSVDQEIDERWLIANSARSESVHQLWQYQEGTTFFTEEQNEVLSTIFPRRSEIDFNKSRRLSSLKARTISWVRHRWNGRLRKSVIGMTKFDHLDRYLVDGNFLEAAFVILRSIIQNAVKHSEPATDLLFVDDRPWFGSRKIPCVRIHYRSTKSASDEVMRFLGVAPIRQASGSRVAYGMYNVGLLTRLLGGSLYVASVGVESQLTVEIHLPIPENKS